MNNRRDQQIIVDEVQQMLIDRLGWEAAPAALRDFLEAVNLRLERPLPAVDQEWVVGVQLTAEMWLPVAAETQQEAAAQADEYLANISEELAERHIYGLAKRSPFRFEIS